MHFFSISGDVHRPLGLKIFGVAVLILILMIFVTLFTSIHLQRVGRKIEHLSKYYITTEQKMAEIRNYGLLEMLLVERLSLPANAPKILSAVAVKESEAMQASIGECSDEALRAESVKLRANYPLTGDRLLIRYELSKSCAKDKLQRVSKLVDDALALEIANEDLSKVLLLSGLKKDLVYVSLRREQQHAAVQNFFTALAALQPSGTTDMLRAQMDETRVDVSRKITDITIAINSSTRESIQLALSLTKRVQFLSWSVTLLACILGLLSASYITKNLMKPLKELLSGTMAVQNGDLDVYVTITTTDELAALGDHFNHMVQELKQKQVITNLFGKYVDPRVVQGLLEQDALLPQEGERQRMSVFFSDIENFTTISEGMTPSGVVRLLNQYFTYVSEPIRTHNGIIDKYIGDSVMAFWGPPFTSARDHALLSCYSALDQQARLEDFRRNLPEILGIRKGVPQINVRMAIATGDVTVGSIGTEDTKSYTVIGDTVNLASRLEGANKFYGTNILISSETYELTKDLLETRKLDFIKVAGKLDPVHVYELLDRKGQISQLLIALRDSFETGLQAYMELQWDLAAAEFEKCLELNPEDGPSKVFLGRVRFFQSEPPTTNWDGTWTYSTK